MTPEIQAFLERKAGEYASTDAPTGLLSPTRLYAFTVGAELGLQVGELVGRVRSLREAFTSRLGEGRPDEQKPWQVLLREAEESLAALEAKS